MYWNHRCLRRVDNIGTTHEETNYYIMECYYDLDGSIVGWTDKEYPYGESLDSLRETLTWMLECLDKPVLDEASLLSQAEQARKNSGEDIFPEARLSLDEVLESLGLEREDVETGEIDWDDEGSQGC